MTTFFEVWTLICKVASSPILPLIGRSCFLNADVYRSYAAVFCVLKGNVPSFPFKMVGRFGLVSQFPIFLPRNMSYQWVVQQVCSCISIVHLPANLLKRLCRIDNFNLGFVIRITGDFGSPNCLHVIKCEARYTGGRL